MYVYFMKRIEWDACFNVWIMI